MVIGRLGTLALEWEPGWDGTEGCTEMLVQMNTGDDDKVD